jgi:hypothetical protein
MFQSLNLPTMKTVPKNLFNILGFIFFFFFLVPFMTNAQVGIGTTDPKSTFEVNGTFGQKVNTITATTALDDTYGSVVICNNSSTAITVTLPDVTLCTGRVYTIKRNATSTANVTIAGTIDGVTNLILKDAGDAATLFSNGTEWKAASNSNSSWNVKGNTGTSSTTNYIGTADATDLVLKTNAISRVNISSAGVTTIGGATDRTKFEADGTIVLEGAATVWDDLLVNPDATSKSGSKSPTYGLFKNNGSQGVFLWFFDKESEQEVYFTVQMPHKYKVGTDLYPHVHWTTATGTPSGTNVVWALEYTVVAIGGSFPTTTTLSTNSVIGAVGTPVGTGQHLITSLGSISGSGIGISTILVCRLYRVPTDSRDTFANAVGLLSMDFHYEMDTEGSRSEYTK